MIDPHDPRIIDAEFTVVSGARYDAPEITPPPYRAPTWSFWRDDLPNLLGGVVALVLAAVMRAWLFPPHH